MKFNGVQLRSRHSHRGREGAGWRPPHRAGGWIVPLAAACCGLVLLAVVVLFAADQLSAPAKSPAASPVSSETDKRAELPEPASIPSPAPAPDPVPAATEPIPAEPAPAGSDVTARNTCTNGQCTSCVNEDCDSLPDVLPDALPGGIELPSLPRVSSESKARATTCIDGRCKTVEN